VTDIGLRQAGGTDTGRRWTPRYVIQLWQAPDAGLARRLAL